MFRKALLLAAAALLTAVTGCNNAVAPREDSTIGGTLGGGNARRPVSDVRSDEAIQDTTKRIGGTLGGGQ